MGAGGSWEVGPEAGRFDGSLRELWARRELLWTLAGREIRIRYKQAVLGAAWAVLQPVAFMAVFTFFFSTVLHVPSDGMPYPLFAYAGLLPWTFFTTAVAFGVPSLTNSAHLVTKIYFPRAILPLASVLAAAVDFGVAAALFAGLLALFGVSPTLHLLWLPMLVVMQVTFVVAVVLFLAALNVVYRDVRYAVPVLMQIWMFLTPIIYSVTAVPQRLRAIYMLNPLAVIIDGYRRTILHGQPPDLAALGVGAVTSMALLWAAVRFFSRAESTFADVI